MPADKYEIRLAGAALNQMPLAWDSNKDNIIDAINQAKANQADIICLPELCISGYGCEDAFFARNTIKRSLDSLLEILPATKDIIVAIGLPVMHEATLYNCCCILADQQIVGFVPKQFLCNSGIHYEPRWFSAWQKGQVSCLTIDQQSYPFGDICFEFNNIKIGAEICEDAWVLDRPACRLAQSNVDLIVNLSASHFAFSKFETRKDLVSKSSAQFNCAYLYVNLLGNESGRAIYDAGTLIAQDGTLVACGQRLGFKDVVLTYADIKVASGKKQLSAEVVKAVAHNFQIKTSRTVQIQNNALESEWETAWDDSADKKNEEFVRAVSLALFDYLRKSNSAGFVVSLSGGADSAAIACLVRFCFEFGLAELGFEGLIKKLPYLKGVESFEQIMKKSLLTVYQAAENSGEVTRNAAEQVARAILSEHHQIVISDIVQQYQELIEKALGRKLSWQSDDITLQNIQARARSPSAWMFANIRNALLLATSNRSEVAVGYATMDGDTSGSISPIAGVDKAFIRKWLLWLEKEGPCGYQPIAALKHINQQQPTAELRPASSAQTDEKDLMPYDLLEVIERAAIRDKLSPKDILDLVQTKFPAYNKAQHLHWLRLFFNLFSKSQWKRERYAPSFHLDDESLDPKTWCRYPILSGCYKKELEELK